MRRKLPRAGKPIASRREAALFVALKILLDEHFPPAVAEQLERRGYDVKPVAERAAAGMSVLRGSPDADLLRWAQAQARVVVTENARDFMRLHRSFLARGEEHAGIVLTSPRGFPRDADRIGHLIRALAQFIDEHPQGFRDNIAWL